MTREEAIEWLIQIKDKYIHDGDEQFDTKRKEALGMAIEALKSERPNGEWIPCSERLPREEEQDDELGVLVTLGNGYSGLQCDWYHGDHWYDWNGFVIAWMPLPKPWK